MHSYGYASRELFVQFIARILKEIPHAKIAMFSTLKYINASNFQKFRNDWNFKFLKGFVIHSKSFDGVNGNFPIGFLIWDLNCNEKLKEVDVEIYDKKTNPIGRKKYYNVDSSNNLNNMLPRIKTNCHTIPLKNAVTPQNKKAKVTSWVNSAIGYFWCNGNDFQQAGQTAIFSSVFSAGNGFYITKKNLEIVAVMFSVRKLIQKTWLNNSDQFYKNSKKLKKEFINDCLIFMLFNGKNLTASANHLSWNNKKWSIVNHFIPFTEQEVNATERFESDFMTQYMENLIFSKESIDVLEKGKSLWKLYFSDVDNHKIREKYSLNRADVGWFQIRKALEERNNLSLHYPLALNNFQEKYLALSSKLKPQIYEYGFLK